jgi:hypothetical protein
MASRLGADRNRRPTEKALRREIARTDCTSFDLAPVAENAQAAAVTRLPSGTANALSLGALNTFV